MNQETIQNIPNVQFSNAKSVNFTIYNGRLVITVTDNNNETWRLDANSSSKQLVFDKGTASSMIGYTELVPTSNILTSMSDVTNLFNGLAVNKTTLVTIASSLNNSWTESNVVGSGICIKLNANTMDFMYKSGLDRIYIIRYTYSSSGGSMSTPKVVVLTNG